MTKTKITRQLLHMHRVENVFDQSLAFALQKLTPVTGHYPGCVLTPVLQHSQRIVYISSNTLVRGNTYYATHYLSTFRHVTGVIHSLVKKAIWIIKKLRLEATTQ